MKNQILPFVLFITLMAINVLDCQSKYLQVSSPLEAAILYFPSPAVMRCLNHSNIPKEYRKASVIRQIVFPGKPAIIQNITIGTTGKKFIFSGSITSREKIIIQKIKGGPNFGVAKGGELKQSFLFGLESLIGLQRRVHIRDKIGNQVLDYETFLKTTKGMISKTNYNLELNGQDRSITGEIKYFLNGFGMLGGHNIIIKGAGLEKDTYKLYEKVGPVDVHTTIKVYD